MMFKLFMTQLPIWARPNHPILQYELAHLKHNSSRQTRFLQLLILAMILGLGGYLYATYIYVSPTQGNITDLAWRILYFPTLLVQVFTSIVALSLGIRSVGHERSKRTWDNLRATEVGAELTLRTRWIAILYRLRAPILAILLVRLILLIGILYDITAFGGRYTEMLTQNLTPAVTDPRIGLVVIALIMTMSLLLPITMIASSAGIGILVSVIFKDRSYSATIQVLLTAFQLFVIGALLAGVTQFMMGQLTLSDGASFALFMAYAGFGDWGLLLLQLGTAGEVWVIVPYGILIGVGLIILMLIQAAITDGMLWLAVKLSESRE